MNEGLMITNYFPVLVFLVIAMGIGILLVALGAILGPRRPDPEKLAPYECGFDAFEDARIPFDVRFYLVAVLFILFDLETAFLFPWAVVLRQIGWFGFISMMLFLALLTIGFLYEWVRGALQWE